MENEDPILTVKEFAKKIKATNLTVLKMIKDGRILAFKFRDGPTSSWRIKSSEVERLISLELHKRTMKENGGK